MSEQEKKEAIPTEGTVTNAPDVKESKIRKWIDGHPKTIKWAKRIGVGTLWLGSTALAYLVGANTKGPEPSVPALNEADTDDDEELEETPAE